MAQWAGTRRPPISLSRTVARVEGYANDLGVLDLFIVQGPFPVAPCQTQITIFASLYPSLPRRARAPELVRFLSSRAHSRVRVCAILGRPTEGRARPPQLAANKRSVLLLNKADLLPDALRLEWAKYFTHKGIAFHFWSAKAAEAALKEQAKEFGRGVSELDAHDEQASDAGSDAGSDEEGSEASVAGGDDERTAAAAEAAAAEGTVLAVAEAELRQFNCEVLGREELMEKLEAAAAAAAQAACRADGGKARKEAHVVVGFVGYPNVGKSSTLNALIGEKKASVAVRHPSAAQRRTATGK
jgi:hypothetical protein